MSLTEFLLARIAEDEAWVEREWLWLGGDKPWSLFEAGINMPGGIGIDPRRLAAECEAKRRIVAAHAAGRGGTDGAYCVSCLAEAWPCPTIEAVALPHANHPDYREERKP